MSMSLKDQKVAKVIADLMTIRLKKQELENLRFYFHSPKRLCITYFDTLLPEVWAKDGGPNLERMGFTTAKELSDWLLKNGAKQTRKPQPYRPLRSIYD